MSPELASAVICNRKFAVLAMGTWDMLEHQRALLAFRHAILPMLLV